MKHGFPSPAKLRNFVLVSNRAMVRVSACPGLVMDQQGFVRKHALPAAGGEPKAKIDVIEFDGETVFLIENEIECSKCGCVNDLVPDQDYVFSCYDCGAKLWKFGDEFS